MYKDFRHYCRPTIPKQAAPGHGRVELAVIINLFTQDRPPATGIVQQNHPANVNHALQALKRTRHRVKSVALPRPCHGVGGLEWEKVLSSFSRR